MLKKLLLVCVTLTLASALAAQPQSEYQNGSWVGGQAWSYTSTPTPFYVPTWFPSNTFTSIQCSMEVNWSTQQCTNYGNVPIWGLEAGNTYPGAHLLWVNNQGVMTHNFIINGQSMAGCIIEYEGRPFEYGTVRIFCPQGVPEGCTMPGAEFGVYY